MLEVRKIPLGLVPSITRNLTFMLYPTKTRIVAVTMTYARLLDTPLQDGKKELRLKLFVWF